jgi:hypothetical protein
MGRYLVYKGRKVYRPGAYPTVRTARVRRALLGVRGKVLIIGEAEEGAPGLNTIDDPNQIREILGSGAGADASAKAFEPSNDEAFPGGASEVAFWQTNQATRATLPLYGDEGAIVAGTFAAGATGDSTQMVCPWTGGALTIDAHIDRWAKLEWGDGRIEYRRIFDNTAADLTVRPGFSSLPTVGLVGTILESPIMLTAKRYGVRMNDATWLFEPVLDALGVATGRYVYTLNHPSLKSPEISDEILGGAALRIKYIGGPAMTNGVGTISAAATNGTTGKTEISLNVAAPPVLDAFATKVLQFADGKQRLITGNSAADPTVILLDLAHALTPNEITALNDLFAAGTPMGASVRDVTSAEVTIEGSAGVATTLKTVVIATADNLTLSFATLGLVTLTDLVSYLNNNTAFAATLPGGVNGDTTLLSSLDFGSATGPKGANAKIDVRFDDVISPLTKGLLKRDVAALCEYITAASGLCTAARKALSGSQEGKELPVTLTTPLKFQGGTRGISTNANWQDGFDALLNETGQHIVALISRDLADEGKGSKATFKAVAEQMRQHLISANELKRKARGGYMGIRGTRAAAIAMAKVLNYEHLAICCQRPECADVNGSPKVHDEWMMGIIAAGCRAGGEVGEPLTAKKIAIMSLTQDSGWVTRNDADVDALTAGGVMIAEEDPRGGFRFVRDLTTWLDDDSTDTKIDGNMTEEARFIADDLPAFIEERFKGKKLKTAGKTEGNIPSITTVRQAVIERCEQYKESPYWVLAKSKDPDDPTGQKIVDGYDRIVVSQSGNTMPIDGRFFLTSGMVFFPVGMSVHVPEL